MRGFEIAETKRRLESLVIHGEVVEVSEDALSARVKFGDDTEEVESDFLPLLQRRAGKDGDEWPVEVGEKVLVLCPGGYAEMGVILGSLPTAVEVRKSNVHRVRYSDGTKIEYDKESHTLTVEAAGSLVVKTKEGTTVVVDGNCSLTAQKVSVVGKGGTLLGLTVEAAEARATSGVVTGECLCAFTGAPHPDFSKSVKAEK